MVLQVSRLRGVRERRRLGALRRRRLAEGWTETPPANPERDDLAVYDPDSGLYMAEARWRLWKDMQNGAG